MYNGPDAGVGEIPSSARLLTSTLIALAVAGVILVTVVLPAEYAIDPTGIGGMLGLTEMGEIKAELDSEAATDHVEEIPAAAASTASVPGGDWTDEIHIELAPDEAIEWKLKMVQGAEAPFEWSTESGSVNYDLHGDGGGEFISYEKGSGSVGESGVLQAAFDGHHGWYWRNRTADPIKLTLRTRGAYSELKQMM